MFMVCSHKLKFKSYLYLAPPRFEFVGIFRLRKFCLQTLSGFKYFLGWNMILKDLNELRGVYIPA